MSSWLTIGVRSALVGLLLSGAVPVGAEPVAGGIERQGVVHTVDYGTNTVNISGTNYTVAIDANVEIAGTYGAFTMLKDGMNVSFTFDLYDDQARVITEIAELPAGTIALEY